MVAGQEGTYHVSQVHRRVPLTVTALLLVGCARADYGERRLDTVTISAGPQTGWAIKRVVEKQGSTTLIGEDGSMCRTTHDRVTRTKVGAWLGCEWTLPPPD